MYKGQGTLSRQPEEVSVTTIPLAQLACVLRQVGSDVELEAIHPVVPASQLLLGQCLVRLSYSGICHTDLYARSPQDLQ